MIDCNYVSSRSLVRIVAHEGYCDLSCARLRMAAESIDIIGKRKRCRAVNAKIVTFFSLSFSLMFNKGCSIYALRSVISSLYVAS